MERDKAQARMREINDTINTLSEAYRHYELIAAGIIESPEEITLQATKAQAAIDKVDVDIIKGIVQDAK